MNADIRPDRLAAAELAPIDRVGCAAYKVPTSSPESDGTFEWQATTLVLVEVSAAGRTGVGFSYADTATATLVRDTLAALIVGRDAFDIGACWSAMVAGIRNLGRPGIASMAISAVDTALWDLKGRLLDLPVTTLLGRTRASVPVYGSGGFTSCGIDDLQRQLAGWVQSGITGVKMKVGREPSADAARVRAARKAIGAETQLMVDANAAYSRKQALDMAQRFAEHGVCWFEEPVSSDDLAGLHLLRDRAPAGMDISAGEYGYDAGYFLRMLQAQAVDVLQADATRCAGITGFLSAAALAEAFMLPLSSHCAPSLHVAACCAAPSVKHLEYFYDHARIEHLLFDGALDPVEGGLRADTTRPGLGLEFRKRDAQRYLV